MQMGEASKEKCSKPYSISMRSCCAGKLRSAMCHAVASSPPLLPATVPKVERQSVRFKMD